MDRRSQSSPMFASSVVGVAALLAVVFSGACTTADAYAFGPTSSPLRVSKARYSPTAIKKNIGSGIHKKRGDGSAVTLYLFPTPPSVSAANIRSQRSRSSSRNGGKSQRSPGTSLPAMSDSVLADSDILPEFHTAHGLLSPEVVMRIANTNELEMGGALHKFLMTYKRKGPMACLPMLSDPEVLPELTRAMRDIA
mmetsp:Transcript_41782/g.87694  ORF Transcript_41782/g.87694 Transcript_41782/m.87694 type:complete len:195 (-) Transcript_41782:468-1052(-)